MDRTFAIAAYNGFSGERRLEVGRLQNAAFRDGTLRRPMRCVACGQMHGAIQAHLEDYDRWRDYIALCFPCHMMVHFRARNAGRWDAYREIVRGGGRFAPIMERARFQGFISRFISTPISSWPAASKENRPDWLVLDLIAEGHLLPGAACVPSTCRCKPATVKPVHDVERGRIESTTGQSSMF